jgi:uncharacterized protein (DUF2062 family)
MKTETIKKQNGFKRLFNLKGDPKMIARGFALGSFVGMLPFPGFQMLISATLATFLRYNRMAAVAGVFNTNLVTGVFVFAFNYWLGKKILGIESSFRLPDRINLNFAKTVMDAGSDVFLSLLLGGAITGIFATFLGYYISLSVLTRKNRMKYEN